MSTSPALVRRWVALLDPIVREGAVGDEPAAVVARSFASGTPAKVPLSVPISDRRPEIASLLDYIRSPDRVTAITRWANQVDRSPPSPLPPDVQPETWWYGQLVRLHAITSFAILTGDREAWSATGDLARFVHAEIQPDHATGLPWAIHAFVLAGGGCEHTAEWVLNACMIQYGGRPAGVALVLLAEALYGLRHVLADPAAAR